ncbi:ankyrin repeat-containing protein [Planoprotostelium fungivorum]|uniref:Ankyrin repeat-containing protein n=1 Tax=Planoprotostelium fungivorum TaxID=1890364 RepID=A0A2P6NR42_9EUKA|nr:ankyrin repeat-containing protein [Planoprotostelium fungivorum]
MFKKKAKELQVNASISEPNLFPPSRMEQRTVSMTSIQNLRLSEPKKKRSDSHSSDSESETDQLIAARKRIQQLELENRSLYEDLSLARRAMTDGCGAHAELIEKLMSENEQLRRGKMIVAGSPALIASPHINPKPSVDEFLSAPAVAKVISITIESNNISLKTSVMNTWSVRETIAKIKKKIPGDTTNYHLVWKPSDSKSYTVLENDRLIDHYKGLEEGVIEFDKMGNYEMKNKKLMRKVPSFRRDKITPATFVHLILEKNYEKLNRLLTDDSRYDLETLGTEKMLPVHAAFQSQDTTIAQLFLDHYERYKLNFNLKDARGWTPLHFAVSSSQGTDADNDILSMLSSNPNVSASEMNQEGEYPLHLFLQYFSNPSCKELGQQLIDKDPSVINTATNSGERPIHKAMANPKVRFIMLKLLLSNQCNVNGLNESNGDTALHMAVRLKRKDIAKTLLYAGADPQLKTKQDHTPLELAKKMKEEELLEVLTSANDLKTWTTKHKLEECYLPFLREELTLETLAAVLPEQEENLLRNFSLESVGMSIRMKNALADLRQEYRKLNFENKLKKAQKSGHQMQNTNTEQAKDLREGLQAITSGDSWLMNHSDLEFSKESSIYNELGIGVSGKVFKGLWRDMKVAIKVFKTVDHKTIDEFKKEFHVMNMVKSPYLIQLFGTTVEPKICMVMEYCSRGSLNDVLKHPDIEVTWSLGLKFVEGMLHGMNSLHSCTPQVLHRDMKSLNLLVTKDWALKMCDFGLSRFNTAENLMTFQRMCGTYHYLGPEMYYTQTATFTDKTEIANRIVKGKYETPYHEHKIKMDFQVIYQVAEKGMRPTMSDEYPQIWKELIAGCLQKDPSDRKNAAQLLQMMREKEMNI